jgi:hypothetical protein
MRRRKPFGWLDINGRCLRARSGRGPPLDQISGWTGPRRKTLGVPRRAGGDMATTDAAMRHIAKR